MAQRMIVKQPFVKTDVLYVSKMGEENLIST